MNTCEPAPDCAGQSRPVRVVHVVLSLDLGGLERLVVDLVDQGRQQGQQPAVVCVERPGTLAADVESLGVRVVCADKPSGIHLATFHRLKQVFRELRPDVVHTHQIGALFYTGFAARQAQVPAVVHTEHGKHFAGRRRTRWLGRWAGRYADRFCCVSRDIADEVQAAQIVPARKIEVVANGIDTARFTRRSDASRLRQELGIPADAFVVGTLGRMSEIKRQDLLIRSFARLAEGRTELHLLLVGDGPLRSELEQLAASLTTAGRIHFAGYQPQPQRYLQLMDVFALASRSEGMPLAVLEAWAAGVPVVASRVGGLPELIDDGLTGLMFSSGDEAGLATALERLLGDGCLAGRLARAGQQRALRDFSLNSTMANYRQIYVKALARRGAVVG
ncbi:MAG TPA: glycosyltransferase [Pirellulales bacterium]|nr:glycosyltransferase [Pirellulales bacterium]